MFLAFILLLFGTIFPLFLDGQTFTNSIVGIAFLVASTALCIVLDKRESIGRAKRIGIRVIAGFDVFLIMILVVLLPAHYKFQKGFNQHIQELRERYQQAPATQTS